MSSKSKVGTALIFVPVLNAVCINAYFPPQSRSWSLNKPYNSGNSKGLVSRDLAFNGPIRSLLRFIKSIALNSTVYGGSDEFT